MLRSTLSVLAISVAEVVIMSPSANAGSSSLTVAIDGLRNQNGQVCLSLFSQAEGFPGRSDRAITVECIQTNEASRGVTFRNLNLGSYAVALYHDANADGRLNTGFFGIPTEGFGFSRNPQISTGAPRFQDTALRLTSPSTSIQIQMNYF